MSQAVSQDIVTAAAEWVGLLDSADASDADWLACEVWCAANPDHRAAFDRMSRFHDRLSRAAPFQGRALKALSARKRSPRRSAALYSLTALAIAGVSGFIWQTDTVRDHFPDHQTQRGELKTVTLSDGNAVRLDTETSVRVSESRTQDKVRLLSGRIFATVKSRPDHRFVVETGFGSATALGTAYEVKLSDNAMTVSVSESRVKVCPTKAPARCQTLTTGQSARVTHDQIIRLNNIDPSHLATWSSGWIDALDSDLAIVLDELNRYRTTPVAFDRAALHDRKVSGVFPINDPDAALRGVATSSGTRIVQHEGGQIVIVP